MSTAKVTGADLDARIAEWHSHRAEREAAQAALDEQRAQEAEDPDRPWGYALIAMTLVGACVWVALFLSTLGAHP